VRLHSTNQQSSFHPLKNNQNNIEIKRESSMKVAVQQEDLQLLAKTLQEQLLVEVSTAEVFEVKCAVNKDGLMILTQHSSDVIVDAQLIFAVIEEVLQSLVPHKEQQVQCFLRVFGEQLPYAKCSLALKQMGGWGDGGIGRWEDEGAVSYYFSPSSSSSPSSLTYSPSIDETDEEELFDPFADVQNLSASKPGFQVKPILLGAALVGIAVLGGGTYLLTRPCVMSECKEIQNAEQLKTKSPQLMRRAKSEKELVAIQQQLAAASATLNAIPSWSPRYQVSKELKASLSGRSEKINQVVKALQTASLAIQKVQTPASSLEELQARQHLWRQAIAPLEAISSTSELYGLVQGKLLNYRVRLHAVNQQIFVEEKWLKKLTAAKAVVLAAEKREATAKSLNEWQKVQSNWLVVVNALNTIPRTSAGYQEAQKLLIDYKPKLVVARDRTTKEQLALKTYQQAVSTANQAKIYQQQNQWQAAATYWEQALQTAKKVPQDSLYYTQAQSLIEPYSATLKQAQEKLQVVSSLQQTRTDLDKTCTNGIRICNFSIDDAGIVVRLTPEYDQIRQNNLANPYSENSNTAVDVTNHLQILREALAVISDNANLSLFLYDSQSQVIYTRTLGG
jgi:tetratricopeptide (TPR) repeat protein